MDASLHASFRIPLSRGLLPRAALHRVQGLGRSVFLQGGGGRGRVLVSAAPRRIVRVVALGEATGAFSLEAELFPFKPPRAGAVSSSQEPSESPFAGGWIGYLGYEFADFLERLPSPASEGMGMPALWFGWYDWAAVWDRGGGNARLEGAPAPGADPAEFEARLRRVRDLLEQGAEELERWEWEGGHTSSLPPSGPMGWEGEAPRLPEGVPLPDHPGVRSSLGRGGFERGVDRIREHIRAGEIYQANLTQQLWAPFPQGEGLSLFSALQRRSPAPFAAYLDTGEGEIASVSPECFLSLRDRTVHTRPIKGTAPADAARHLAASEKDRAENVMIVDLLRNDLSRVCRPDSVRVPRLLELESHPPVHHLVSTVTGELQEGLGAVDLLRATFPGGSITGAPKLRAIEILREEEPVRREVYTGALGLIERNGDMELSIAIRTAVVRGGWASWGAGGGITLASDPSAEWRESLDKAGSFLQALSERADRERLDPTRPDVLPPPLGPRGGGG